MTELENSNLQPEPEDQPTKPNVAALELVQRLEAMGCVHHVWLSSGPQPTTFIAVESGLYIFYADGRTNFTERQSLIT